MSYSALASWLDCGERFRLERVLNAPQSKAWWFIGGDAVHKATERCDLDGITDAESARAVFEAVWTDSLATLADEGVDVASVKAGGRTTNDYPNKENHQWWADNGPVMVQNWVTWRDAKFAEGWQFYPLPDGSPAIEVPVQVEFDDVLVKGYIDRVMVNDSGEVIVVDLKSGSRLPESTLQLGIYALGMSRNFGITPSLGGFYMTRKGDVPRYTSLLHYTHDMLGNWFMAAKRGIEGEVFIPHVTALCGSCSVSPYCTAVGGSPAPLSNGLTS